MTETLIGLKDETLRILRYYKAESRIIDRMERVLREGSRAELGDTMIALKCIENDLVIRICKLDDKRKDTVSFKNALKTFKKNEKNQERLKEIEETYEQFKKLTENLKDRRNEELGHLKKGSFDHYDPKYELLPAIRAAVKLTDLLNGEIIKYSWKDDIIYEDLRELVDS